MVDRVALVARSTAASVVASLSCDVVPPCAFVPPCVAPLLGVVAVPALGAVVAPGPVGVSSASALAPLSL